MFDQLSLIEEVVDYLRKINVLKGTPLFEKTVKEMRCVDPKGEWDEYFMDPRFWHEVDVEFHESVFDKLQSRLQQTSRDEILDQLVALIPDSPDSVILELGSEYGDKGAGYLAQFKPNAQVVLVSKSWPKIGPAKYLFVEPQKPDFKKLTFTRGQELLQEANLTQRVNGLYRENGLENVEFHEHELTLHDTNLENLPDFLRRIVGKNIYVLGQQSPKTLPFLIGKLYNTLNARYMNMSLTAQEKVTEDQFSWDLVKKNLGLDEEETHGLVLSTHDPLATATPYSLSDKYDYNQPEQKRVGVMIKLAIALALAREINGNVLNNGEPNRRGYNKIDHYVEARRT